MYSKEKNGQVHTFEFNWDYVEELEKDPDYDIFNDMASMDKHPRITTLMRLSKLVGWDYKEFVAAGFSANELSEILLECLKDAGFRSEEPTQGSSSLVAGSAPI